MVSPASDGSNGRSHPHPLAAENDSHLNAAESPLLVPSSEIGGDGTTGIRPEISGSNGQPSVLHESRPNPDPGSQVRTQVHSVPGWGSANGVIERVEPESEATTTKCDPLLK